MNQQGFHSYLTNLIGEFAYLLPELTLIIGSLLVVLFDLIYGRGKQAQIKTMLTLLVLAVTAMVVPMMTVEGYYLNEILFQDSTTHSLKYLFLFIAGASLLFPNSKRQSETGEYQFLILMIVLGGFFLIQVRNLLLFYVALELVSITSYVLISFAFGRKGFEAGIKYLLFGAMSSGLMLYGLSLIYGLIGGLEISQIAEVYMQGYDTTWLNLSLLLFMVGIFFKLSVVPFHIWSPDVYQAGPISAVALISVLPKIAVLVFFFHFTQSIAVLGYNIFDWKQVLSAIALISMFVGNLSALLQDNAKRMMAYSSIAHAGTLLIAIVVGSDFAYEAMLFYAVVYGVMNIALFYFIDWMEENDIQNISELAGLGKQFPLWGVAVTIVLLSLVGLPPTGGFSAKLLIFSALWEEYLKLDQAFLLWLFALGLLNAALSLFYYLKIPFYLFVKPAVADLSPQLSIRRLIYLSIAALVVLVAFFKTDWVLGLMV
ncbi:NADH-quinone oxidoreductase subunit N [Reichenbachiella ulvae]|uniref:NADH-quinone oxidoreductase subunit N n=1 Tax=Reichenbachiella ulvae TaxID=2980104 RepID=A0ABT3CUF8_9BACT|nr:NADH-quinone oxidoreductase subunit N [Reichenbachiella ulvae]MCV9387272.1 NADH-quinone oxidoreductase subunit N [Reichenbachiella ulvae]